MYVFKASISNWKIEVKDLKTMKNEDISMKGGSRSGKNTIDMRDRLKSNGHQQQRSQLHRTVVGLVLTADL